VAPLEMKNTIGPRGRSVEKAPGKRLYFKKKSVYNKVTNSRKTCCYCGTQNIHTAGKKVSFSTLILIPETSTIQVDLPQEAFKKSNSLNVYVLHYAPQHEDVWDAQI
jgi:hypothetical protein